MTAQQFFVAAVPVFLAALLGVGAALFMDWLKTRRENRKAARERREKELTQLNSAATAMGYDIEALLHIVMQQVLPHREQSHAAAAALHTAENNAAQLRAFVKSMNLEFPAMTCRCPEPYFIELELFKEIPFVLEKNPELLKRSGWMVSYARALKEIISERNKRIDIATRANAAGISDIQVLEEQIRVQGQIGNTEVINSLMLFEQFIAICKNLEKITESYKDVSGAHLKVGFPAPLDSTLGDLRRIAVAVVPDFPPQEPER